MKRLSVTVAWATPTIQDVVALELPLGAAVGTAIAASGLVECYGLARETIQAGLGGRLARDDTPLADGDRIDLCRPLTIDPKEARRLRAAVRDRQDPKTVDAA